MVFMATIFLTDLQYQIPFLVVRVCNTLRSTASVARVNNTPSAVQMLTSLAQMHMGKGRLVSGKGLTVTCTWAFVFDQCMQRLHLKLMPGFPPVATARVGGLQYGPLLKARNRSATFRDRSIAAAGAQTSIEQTYTGCKDVLKPVAASLKFVSQPDVAFLLTEIYDKQAYLQHGICLQQGATVLDVGANIGIFANYAAQHVGPAGRVIACEPIPPVFQAAQANIAALHAPGVLGGLHFLLKVATSSEILTIVWRRQCRGEAAQCGRWRWELQHS